MKTIGYRIIVKKVEEGVFEKREWNHLRDKAEDDPSGKKETYGYVYNEQTEERCINIYEQQIDGEIDLKAIINVFNKDT